MTIKYWVIQSAKMTLQRYESEMRSRGNTAAADKARELNDEHGDVPLEDEALVTSLKTPEEIGAFARSVSSRFNKTHAVETPLAEPLSRLMTAALEMPGVSAVAFGDYQYPRLDIYVINSLHRDPTREREVDKLHADMFGTLRPNIDSSIYFPFSSALLGFDIFTPQQGAKKFTRVYREVGMEFELIGFAKFMRE